MTKAYILFTRIPAPHKTKTRLTKTLTPQEASHVQAILLRDLFQKLMALPQKGIAVFVAYSDEKSPAEFLAQLPDQFQAFPQVGTTLGERMDQAIQHVFTLGYQKVILTGSDIPQLTANVIESAFEKMTEVVLGPSVDGGYYLIGATKQINLASLFLTDIKWGGADVLQQTLALLGSKTKVTLLPPLLDIDEPQDLQRIISEIQTESPSFKRWLEKNRRRYDEKSDH